MDATGVKMTAGVPQAVTVHELVAHNFSLTAIAGFLDLRSTVRFISLFSRADKKDGIIVNPFRFIPSSVFVQRFLQKAMEKRSEGRFDSWDCSNLVHCLRFTEEMVQLSTLASVFKSIAALKPELQPTLEFKAAVSAVDADPSLRSWNGKNVSGGPQEATLEGPDTIALKLGGSTTLAQLTLHFKCCVHGKKRGKRCGRIVLWKCLVSSCGEVCTHCSDHSEECGSCGLRMCRGCSGEIFGQKCGFCPSCARQIF